MNQFAANWWVSGNISFCHRNRQHQNRRKTQQFSHSFSPLVIIYPPQQINESFSNKLGLPKSKINFNGLFRNLVFLHRDNHDHWTLFLLRTLLFHENEKDPGTVVSASKILNSYGFWFFLLLLYYKWKHRFHFCTQIGIGNSILSVFMELQISSDIVYRIRNRHFAETNGTPIRHSCPWFHFYFLRPHPVPQYWLRDAPSPIGEGSTPFGQGTLFVSSIPD